MENQSTSYVFNNPDLVQNIRHDGGRYIAIQCNDRKRRITKESTLKVYGKMLFDDGAVATILSFNIIREKY